MLLVLPMLVCMQPADKLGETLNSFEQQLQKLDEVIGAFPPNIKTKEELETVRGSYNKLLTSLDEAIKANPTVIQFLFQRGYLQSMGHNMDVPGAFEASARDLALVVDRDPNHVPARIELGMLLVNAKAELAPKAEELFRRAQELSGNKPLEDAQRGIFFALYYQGRMKSALAQANLLVKNWPSVEQYSKLRQLTSDVLARTSKAGPEK